MKANLKLRLAVYNHYFILGLITESKKDEEIIKDFEEHLKGNKIEGIVDGYRRTLSSKEHIFLLKCKK